MDDGTRVVIEVLVPNLGIWEGLSTLDFSEKSLKNNFFNSRNVISIQVVDSFTMCWSTSQ